MSLAASARQIRKKSEKGWKSGQGAEGDEHQGCWDGSFCGFGNSQHDGNEGSGVIKGCFSDFELCRLGE